MYETFEHTADLGLRIRAGDLNTLFAEAGRCLFSTIVEDLDAVDLKQTIEIKLEGDEREYLLFDWLNELLYRCDTEHMLFSRFDVKVSPKGLAGMATGEMLDRDRHRLTHEIKAITYHGLKVEQQPDGSWLAEVIVDI
jgi:SHS2 domain-containing protein